MKPISKQLIVIFFLTLFFQNHPLVSQIAINTDNSDPDASAILDVKSTDKGMLIPRMTSIQRVAIAAPATGLLVFDTDTGSFWFYDSTTWIDLGEKNDADSDPTNEMELPSGGTLGQFLQTDGAGTVSWAMPTDNVDDADADATNELQTLSLSGTDLSISNGNTLDITSITDEDWEITSGTNITNVNEGHVGIGNIAATQNRWQLTVKDTVNAMLNTDSVDVSELFLVLTRNLNENNTGIGIGFQSTSTVSGMGAAIMHERTNSNSRGKLHFATKSSGSAAAEDLPINMTLDEEGRLGIGTVSPSEYLHIYEGNILADRGDDTTNETRSLTLGGARSDDSTFGRIDFENYDTNDGDVDYIGASIQANNGGDATDNGNLRFLTYDGSLTERMRITENGNVGIGTTNPTTAKLVVKGTGIDTTFSSQVAYLNADGVTIASSGLTNTSYSIFADGRVGALSFHGFSDERIKNIVGCSNSKKDLATLNQIQITDYTMKDNVLHGDKAYKKVIAQQVAKVFPQAIANNSVEIIPNIFKTATIDKDGWIALETDLQKVDKVKIIFEKSEEILEVLETKENAFRVQPATRNSQLATVFVYGRQVNDFHTVDYEAISMLNVSATQQLAKENEILKNKISKLEEDNAQLKEQVNQIGELKTQLEQIQAQLNHTNAQPNSFTQTAKNKS